MILRKVIYLTHKDHPQGGGWFYQISEDDDCQGPFETASEAKNAMWEEARFKRIELPLY